MADSYDECRQAAAKALELDSALAEAHAVVGFARMTNWQWEAAEAAFRRAIELNPSSVVARQWYAQFLRAMLRLDEVMAEIRRAEALDPLSLPVKTMVGWVLFNQRRYDEALAQWDRVLEMDPDYGLAIYNKGLVYGIRRMGPEVIASAEQAARRLGEESLHMRWLHAIGHAVDGQHERALRIQSELERRFPAALSLGAVIYHLLGEDEIALDRLEAACEERLPWLVAAQPDIRAVVRQAAR